MLPLELASRLWPLAKKRALKRKTLTYAEASVALGIPIDDVSGHRLADPRLVLGARQAAPQRRHPQSRPASRITFRRALASLSW